MSTEKEKHIGISHVIGSPNKRLVWKQKEGSIHKKHLSQDLQHEVDRIDDLQNQIDSLEVAGVAVSNQFGDNQHISISQKALTAAINSIWAAIEDITGEVKRGISMIITPNYFIGDGGCSVSIHASAAVANGIFEYIAFYADDVLVVEADQVYTLEHEMFITDTTVIKCVAKILGIEYTEQKTITRLSAFWLGAGDNYSDIMDVAHNIPVTACLRGAYDVSVSDSDHIFIVMGTAYREAFLRADINGIEIPFTESTVEIGGATYCVLTSVETYSVGTYNIDING